MTIRVTDFGTPAHPVLGANVTFQVVVSRPAPAPAPVSVGGIVVTRNPAPIIVSSSRTSVLSDAAGLATLLPSSGAAQGAIAIQGTSAAGTSILPFHLLSLAPVLQAALSEEPSDSGGTKPLYGIRHVPRQLSITNDSAFPTEECKGFLTTDDRRPESAFFPATRREPRHLIE